MDMATTPLSPESETLSPLPPALFHGLIGVTVCGFLSFFCSFSLFVFLTYRIIARRSRGKSKASLNQFFFLIYNLVIADLHQSVAFLLNVHALSVNAIDVGSGSCWTQGWYVSVGDLSNSVFILAIAVHTFMSVVKGYKLPTAFFYWAVSGLWLFVYVLAIIGVGRHHHGFYVRAVAWCWINSQFQAERLWLHYFWIFVCIFLTIILYSTIYLTIVRRSRRLNLRANNAVHLPASNPHALPLMVLYPFIYTVCTMPLAAGRLATMAGVNVSSTYFCVAGAMIASNGFLDAIIYGTTRRGILMGEITAEAVGIETFVFGVRGLGTGLGTVTTIVANRASVNSMDDIELHKGGRKYSTASREHLYSYENDASNRQQNGDIHTLPLQGIKTSRTVKVTSDRDPMDTDRSQSALDYAYTRDEHDKVYGIGRSPSQMTGATMNGSVDLHRSSSRMTGNMHQKSTSEHWQVLGDNVKVDLQNWEVGTGSPFRE